MIDVDSLLGNDQNVDDIYKLNQYHCDHLQPMDAH